MPRVRSQTIAGKKWRIETEALHGYCDHRTNEIGLSPEQTDEQLCGTIIHEGIHAAFPEASEAKVKEAEKGIAALLLRMGTWKRKPEAFG